VAALPFYSAYHLEGGERKNDACSCRHQKKRNEPGRKENSIGRAKKRKNRSTTPSRKIDLKGGGKKDTVPLLFNNREKGKRGIQAEG